MNMDSVSHLHKQNQAQDLHNEKFKKSKAQSGKTDKSINHRCNTIRVFSSSLLRRRHTRNCQSALAMVFLSTQQ